MIESGTTDFESACGRNGGRRCSLTRRAASKPTMTQTMRLRVRIAALWYVHADQSKCSWTPKPNF